MKTFLVILIFLFLCVKVYSQNYDLTVKVEGLENIKGNLLFGLYNNGSSFPEKNKAMQGTILPITKLTEFYTFQKLAPGSYAIAVIHDENKDGELTTNFIGIPKEGFGFSNNAMGTFGPPSFKKASVSLGTDAVIVIKLRYM